MAELITGQAIRSLKAFAACAAQVFARFTVNGADSTLASEPIPTVASHGDFYYERTPAPSPWPHWTGGPYNDTTATIFVAGDADDALTARPERCPREGCGRPPVAEEDRRDGLLYWSRESTWTGASPPLAVPQEVRCALCWLAPL